MTDLEQAVKEYHRKLGMAGGKARAKALSPKRRAAIAKKAAKTRWAKERKTA